MASTVRELMSTQEYFPTRPYSQLIDGEVVQDEPTEGHRVVVTRILQALNDWAEAVPRRGAAFTGLTVRLDECNVFGPDVAYVRGDRLPPERIHYIDGPPDLAVEVRSLSTWRYNLGPKLRSYERFGLPELWLVDAPVGSVLVFRRSDPSASDFDVALEYTRAESLASPLLRFFDLPIDSIFAPLRPRD
jgi:Uma2 family endonuclease